MIPKKINEGTEEYDIVGIGDELKKMQGLIRGKDVMSIALQEHVGINTVYTYLKGDISIPALGASILNRCNAILAKKLKA